MSENMIVDRTRSGAGRILPIARRGLPMVLQILWNRGGASPPAQTAMVAPLRRPGADSDLFFIELSGTAMPPKCCRPDDWSGPPFSNGR